MKYRSFRGLLAALFPHVSEISSHTNCLERGEAKKFYSLAITMRKSFVELSHFPPSNTHSFFRLFFFILTLSTSATIKRIGRRLFERNFHYHPTVCFFFYPQQLTFYCSNNFLSFSLPIVAGGLQIFGCVRYLIVPFCESCSPSKHFVNFITWLGYVNSALNPVIYTIFNLEYRRAFKKLLGIKR